ncbi:CMRF35-like molecule 9 isoform X3 [Balaenoptera acutorostrata]|uniref:CMRF35-like molecule 9 isoform X3 n=1 Tax=Balaenoptera acutorostrata TaxID=9767 RepID=A0A383ZYU1_BALAC|nr:CMRF35-like molecule 9 isoform X3 [Balaenoptera acutorostrata]
MRPLVLLWGCLVLPGYGSLVGPKEISGFEGGTVSLQCTYGEELKKYRKYWCREGGFLISRCSGTVYSGEYGQEGRVSVHDSPRQLRFEVILRNLTLKDMGQYWCGVKRVGFDKTFSVSLLVFPGTSPYARTSPYAAALPNAGTSPHPATSPPAGISRQATQLDSTSTEDTNFVPSRSSSKPRVSIPMTRMLAPVLVLLALLLATGLAALGSYMLQWRKKAQLAMETPRKEKVHLSHLPLGNSWVPEYAVIDLAGPTGPPASPKPSASPNVEIQCLSQTSKEDEASWQTPEGDMTPGPPLPVSRDEPDFSKFISV